METMNDTIPPTEPTAAKKPAKPKKAAAPSGPKRGSALAPSNLAGNREAMRDTRWYWVGTLPGSPVDFVSVAGQTFPKLEEKISWKKDGTQLNVPVIGALLALTKADIERMREALPRTIMRFTDGRGEPKSVDEIGVGEPVESAQDNYRKGFLITIAKKTEIEEAAKANRAVRQYSQRDGDEPAARYLFAQVCEDQEKPRRCDSYPEPLEQTDLVWPE